ncbi:glycosyltransferase family 2 protein [Nordella sp. HKS 07]|uniref:glycosyltransferase family 2 protein n=1 Tax=Nordella sp. HKS 07 TaxID=2712222 RepID=UPI0013E1D87C|nr:glycosyltransferase family A protein [Nordella sp. HKS 07]QIG51344.1 glycosyltransferase family 2 protein [Nordella sp. HKS 07]
MSHPRCDPLPSVEGENSIPTPPTSLVTVAITAYERADLFHLCLASVCRQSYRNLEIYVFDNSNTDAVQNCVTEIADDRIVYTRNTSNIRDLIIINHQKAWIQRAGVYHIVLSSDCGLNERAIELMVAVLRSDASLCAVAADACMVDVASGKRSPQKIKFPEYVSESVPNSHDRLDAYRMLRDAFFTLPDIGVSYHTLMVSDLLTYANLEHVYNSESSEHQTGLEVLMQKPAFGMIRQQLIEDFPHDNHYDTEHLRRYRHFTQAATRQQFLEKNNQALISLGINVLPLQLGLIKLFARCAYRYPQEQFFASICRVVQLAFPLLFAACLVPLFAPLAGYRILNKSRIRWRKRRRLEAASK